MAESIPAAQGQGQQGDVSGQIAEPAGTPAQEDQADGQQEDDQQALPERMEDRPAQGVHDVVLKKLVE